MTVFLFEYRPSKNFLMLFISIFTKIIESLYSNMPYLRWIFDIRTILFLKYEGQDIENKPQNMKFYNFVHIIS